MKTFLIGLLLASQTAFAGLSEDIQTLSELVDVGTNGGEANIETYDIKRFNYKPLVQNLLAEIQDSHQGCSMQTAIGRKQVVGGGFGILTSEASQLLKKLDRQGKLKAAIGYFWNGDEGDSEYCTIEKLDLYFINGEKLSITLNSTT